MYESNPGGREVEGQRVRAGEVVKASRESNMLKLEK